MNVFILPDLDWLCLLGPILRDSAKSGDVLEVHTPAMYRRVVAAVEEAGRDDLVVRLGPERKEGAA